MTMGKTTMEGREPRQGQSLNINCNSSGTEGATSFYRSTSTSSEGRTSHLAASTSSPSLLAGCADSNTHAGADIERHVKAHNVHVVFPSQSPPLSPIPVSPVTPVPVTPVTTAQSAPSFSLNFTSSDVPPDAVFLTPSIPRPQHAPRERPSSAPSNYLERISGTLLRLVGDHYLCSTCGRQLRTIGDQLTIETQISNIRRAFSASQLNLSDGET